MYDVAIIGGGVVGGMLARMLSSYKLNICILEKENDVAMGASKANSAIVHAGFDAAPGTLKAKLNVKGSEMMEQTAKELGVKFKRNGSLVVGFNAADKKKIEELYARGIKNGVKELSILSMHALHEIEPNISPDAVCALYAPTGAIVCPYALTIAAIGNAMDNGADLRVHFEVTAIHETGASFAIISSNGDRINAKYVVNAAGINADAVAAMAGKTDIKIHPRRGEYVLLDKTCGGIISHTIFRTPSAMGKGILVTPTVDGNLLLGPTADNIEDKNDTATTADGLSTILAHCTETTKGIHARDTITSFCGLRAVGNTGDFIIQATTEHFINAAGIESPGLSASPAIAAYITEMLRDMGLELTKNENFNPIRKPAHRFREASVAEKNRMIMENRSFGRIICRCEGVSEGEIREAIRTNPPARDLDGVKRRTRAQMGRCQGGFCMPYIMEILSEELGVPYDSITKNGGNSKLMTGKTKEGCTI
ncbi:MAG: NAD(P)/FAD-dependent oxidoreductase [Clostridia bacterium]|nr:NAD(P)/FAD-dependent oxidoreductase [Clostridia bacterium]